MAFGNVGLSKLGRRRHEEALLNGKLEEAIDAIRGFLDSDLVLKATVKYAHSVASPSAAAIWLTTGQTEPTLAHVSTPRDTAAVLPEEAPDWVLYSARRHKVVVDRKHQALAVPIKSRDALIGVLGLWGVEATEEHVEYLKVLAKEAGFAVETAHLYESAVAERDKSRAILDRVGDGVVVTDSRGSIIEVSPAARSILDWGDEPLAGLRCEHVIGLRIGERVVDCSAGCQLLKLMEQACNNGSLANETWRPSADGRKQPLLASVAAVPDPDGNISGIVHSFRDITKLKEAEEAKTLFLATASHELKTPLTVIQGFSEFLTRTDDVTDEERSTALEAIHRRAVELNRIVENLLLTSRIEVGRLHLDLEDFDMRSSLSERAKAMSAARGREVVAEVAADIPRVRAQPDAFVTVVDHLLDNALKYSPDGGPIKITALVDEPWVVVRVIDRGMGMDAETMAHAFDRFWQGESTDVRRFGGTGIGLFIVRSIIEAMNGQVGVSSKVGSGSTVWFRLLKSGADRPQESSNERSAARGEESMIREFMRQLGIPERSNS
ncbi:MAG: ATP-binding protein [Actinomycetota bacterium]